MNKGWCSRHTFPFCIISTRLPTTIYSNYSPYQPTLPFSCCCLSLARFSIKLFINACCCCLLLCRYLLSWVWLVVASSFVRVEFVQLNQFAPCAIKKIPARINTTICCLAALCSVLTTGRDTTEKEQEREREAVDCHSQAKVDWVEFNKMFSQSAVRS